MNENFLDDDGDAEHIANESAGDVNDSKSDERRWQYDMLESVIGKKLQPDVKKK